MSSAPGQSILLVEDNPPLFNEIKSLMGFLGYDTFYVDGQNALTGALEGRDYTAVLLGAFHSERDRVEALEKMQSAGLPVILINQDKQNLENYQSRFSQVLAHLEMPLKYQPVAEALQQAGAALPDAASSVSRLVNRIPKLGGSSDAIKYVRTMIEQVARTDASVLILGESGTGKEVVARNIHALSNRCKSNFVPVNCGAIPSDLLESELFGHEKGAFTGAITARQGRFELAEQGTLFLDEIGDMSLPMQVKLLRVLQERTYERVGSNRSMNADVRILAATHRNLERNIGEGQFREDLFYRLNVFPIEIPPLRERLGDVPGLIQDQIDRLEQENRGSVRLTADAIEALCRYRWPGNIRELANLVERLTILYPGGVVEARQLPPKYQPSGSKAGPPPFDPARMFADDEVDDELEIPLTDTFNGSATLLPSDGLDLKEHIAQTEIQIIRQALDASNGVVAHAANLLKMRRTTLVEKLKKYGINS